MHTVVLCMIVAVTTFDYLASIGWIPPLMRFAPEMMSLLVTTYVLVAGVQTRFRYIRAVYWLIFGGLLFILVSGLVINSVSPGATIAGLRTYIRALPFFFLPAVFAFSPAQIRTQISLLFAICLLQVPIAIQQRMVTTARGGYSGDFTFGTLMDSGISSIFQISVGCILLAAFLRRRISPLVFFPMLLLVLVPTMINETKSTLVFLPLGFITVFLLASKGKELVANAVKVIVLLALFLPIFVVVYDHFQPDHRPGILEFFSDAETVERYKTKGVEIGDRLDGGVPRLDRLTAAVKFALSDPLRPIFGVGAGNATPSALGPQFEGRYFALLAGFISTLFNIVVVELGFLAVAILLFCKWSIFQDCRAISAETDIHGLLGLGLTGVVAIFVLGLVYANLSWSASLSYLFWYFSGLVAAHRMRLASG